MVGQQGNLELIGSILKEKKLHIPKKRIASYLTLFERAQEIFPQPQQQALLVHLLHSWESSKKKVVAQLEELGERQLPLTVVMGVLAEEFTCRRMGTDLDADYVKHRGLALAWLQASEDDVAEWEEGVQPVFDAL